MGRREQASVRWWVRRHVARAALLKAVSQLGDYLCAQDFYLLENYFLGQSGVVDEEQLALVVTGPVSEAEGLFNYLLHGADGQWSLRREVLEAWPVAIDWGVVEVGAEEVFSFLFGFTNEDLAAKSDDCLVRLTMAIAFKATAVEVHQLGSVLLIPEDIVVEEAIAVVRGLFGNLWRANGTVPDKGRNSIQRCRSSGKPF